MSSPQIRGAKAARARWDKAPVTAKRLCVGCLYRVGFGTQRIANKLGYSCSASVIKILRAEPWYKSPSIARAKWRKPVDWEARKAFNLRLAEMLNVSAKMFGLTPEEKRARVAARALKRYHSDPEYMMRARLRRRLRRLMFARKGKGIAVQELVGCSLPELKARFETMFPRGMSWQNYGEWEIDHIVPCARFNLNDPDEAKRCFHFTNLQPLWDHENLEKSDSLERTRQEVFGA